jgi:hypothetical protein
LRWSPGRSLIAPKMRADRVMCARSQGEQSLSTSITRETVTRVDQARTRQDSYAARLPIVCGGSTAYSIARFGLIRNFSPVARRL